MEIIQPLKPGILFSLNGMLFAELVICYYYFDKSFFSLVNFCSSGDQPFLYMSAEWSFSIFCWIQMWASILNICFQITRIIRWSHRRNNCSSSSWGAVSCRMLILWIVQKEESRLECGLVKECTSSAYAVFSRYFSVFDICW